MRLRDLREDSDLTQRALANRLDGLPAGPHQREEALSAGKMNHNEAAGPNGPAALLRTGLSALNTR